MNIQDLTSHSEDVAELLKAMANSHRLLILCELITVSGPFLRLKAVVPLSQSALSQHLAKLREYGVVSTRRESQSIYYSLADPRVASLIGTLYELFCTPTKSGSKRRKK